MKNYLITGISGVGKSAVGEAIATGGYRVIEFDGTPGLGVEYMPYRSRYDVRTSQPSDFVRGDGWDALRYVEWHVDRERLLSELQEGNDRAQFVCAYANNWHEFRDDFDGIFLLEAPSSVIEARLLTRTSGDWGRKHPEELIHALETAVSFNQQLRQLGAACLDATEPVNVIVNKILKATEETETSS